ncbi:MAG: N-acetylmuramidase family protein [Alphaproteobacteria bacterium]|nr:N-acetylmuramidase family protein [Alphaproteobacteria bacterium]
MINFIGAATRLVADDIARAAKALECEEAVVRAVIKVESGGAGFLSDGRPKILFEAHLFAKLTKGRHNSSHPDISSAEWNRALYQGGRAEYDRLARAMALDEGAALQAASWGMFQILGLNHARCGFATAHDFVAAMVEGEGRQLDAFVAFVKANARLWDAAINRDWAAFARWYNGPAYAQNKYDQKLAAAYEAAVTATA